MNTDIFKNQQATRRLIQRLGDKLPDHLKDDPDWLALQDMGCAAAVTIVHFIHRRAAYETNSKDYEFSRHTMLENWAAGRDDVAQTLDHPIWKERRPPEEGVAIFDLAEGAGM